MHGQTEPRLTRTVSPEPVSKRFDTACRRAGRRPPGGPGTASLPRENRAHNPSNDLAPEEHEDDQQEQTDADDGRRRTARRRTDQLASDPADPPRCRTTPRVAAHPADHRSTLRRTGRTGTGRAAMVLLPRGRAAGDGARRYRARPPACDTRRRLARYGHRGGGRRHRGSGGAAGGRGGHTEADSLTGLSSRRWVPSPAGRSGPRHHVEAAARPHSSVQQNREGLHVVLRHHRQLADLLVRHGKPQPGKTPEQRRQSDPGLHP